MNYRAFTSKYADQLREVEDALDETLGDAWDFNLDPLALQVGVASQSRESLYCHVIFVVMVM
jgi:WASH complex subunit 7